VGKRLCQAVETYFYYNTSVFKGQTWNEIRKSTGTPEKKPVLLNTDGFYWSWFFDLHGARQYSDGIPQSLSFTEINAWRALMDAPVEPHHIRLIRMMDGAYMKAFIKVQKEREANK